jgi:hypothetical protein
MPVFSPVATASHCYTYHPPTRPISVLHFSPVRCCTQNRLRLTISLPTQDLDVEPKKEEQSFFGSFFSASKGQQKKKGPQPMEAVRLSYLS